MQAMDTEQKKSVMVSAEVHRRIVSLREGDQTYGDVIELSVQALEREKARAHIPCVDDFPDEEINRRAREMKEHPECRISLEESMRLRAAAKGKPDV